MERIDAYYADLRENNFNLSSEKAKESFQTIFESVKKAEAIQQPNISIAEIEKELLNCIQAYKDSNQGPSVDTIFSEEITFIIPHLCSTMRDIQA